MSRATENELAALHGVIARALKERIEGGSASASDIAAAISFLKNNGITAAPEGSPEMEALKEKLGGGSSVPAADDLDLQAALADANVLSFPKVVGNA